MEYEVEGKNNERIAVKADEERTAKKSSSSSQFQLLNIAKSFVLDGALLSSEHQMPIEDRCRKRERLSILRQQQNLEVIVKRAMQYCSDSNGVDKPDHDWFSSFTELAEKVSNKTMQDLWAKILAGEISKPGSFSRKTLSTFRSLSINDAKLLAKASSLACKDGTNKNIRIISGSYQTPGLFNFFSKAREQQVNLSHFGLSYTDILTLIDNHLIFSQEAESREYQRSESIHFIYNGLALDLVANKDRSILRFYKFTPIGAELVNLISDKPDQEFFSHLKQQLQFHFDNKQ